MADKQNVYCPACAWRGDEAALAKGIPHDFDYTAMGGNDVDMYRRTASCCPACGCEAQAILTDEGLSVVKDPSWSVQTWESMGLEAAVQSGKWQTTLYPTLDDAMNAFLGTPAASKARLTLGEDIGMCTEAADAEVCTLPRDVARAMLESHDRISQSHFSGESPQSVQPERPRP